MERWFIRNRALFNRQRQEDADRLFDDAITELHADAAGEALLAWQAVQTTCHRQFMRTLRALRDLRRYAGAVTIHNQGNVNIAAQQQVNTATRPASPTGD